MKFLTLQLASLGLLSWRTNAYPSFELEPCRQFNVGDPVMGFSVLQGNDIFVGFTADGVDVECDSVITSPQKLLIRHTLSRSHQVLRVDGASFKNPRTASCEFRQDKDSKVVFSNYGESDLELDFLSDGDDVEITISGAHASRKSNLERTFDCTITISETKQPTSSPVTAVPTVPSASPTLAPIPSPSDAPTTGTFFDVEESDFAASIEEASPIYVEIGDTVTITSEDNSIAFYQFGEEEVIESCPLNPEMRLLQENGEYTYIVHSGDANAKNKTYIAAVGPAYAASCQGDDISFLVLSFEDRPPIEILILFFLIIAGVFAIAALLFVYTKVINPK